MASVYQVRDPVSGQSVACKLMSELLQEEVDRLRFEREFRLATRFDHPNLIRVFEMGYWEKRPFYTMELLSGQDLRAYMQDLSMRMEWEDWLKVLGLVGGQMLAGLEYIHNKQVVHRDLKPENVLVVQAASTEIARVVDFGIAISNEKTDIRLTSTGMAMGTPGYVAPEQVSGTEELDARADQYALGVSLYEMLTGGTLPFMGDPMDVVTTKVSTEAPALATRMPEGTIAPPGLARIVEKMIARKPDRRFADMAEVAAALDRFCASRGSAAETETAAVRVAPSRRRTPLYAALGLAVIAGGTAVAWTLTHGSAEAENAPTPVIAKAEPAAPPPHPTPPPPATTPPPATPDPTPTTATEPDPIEIDPAQTVEPPTRVRPGHKPSRTRKPTIVASRPTDPTKDPVKDPAKNPIKDPAPDPSLPKPLAPAPPTASSLEARLLGVDVQGALSPGVVQRAVERVRPAIERCTSLGSATQNAKVLFTIDESKRPRGVRGSGVPGASLNCLVTALGGVRTEAAPDVGDAEVVVRIAFRTKP